MSAITKERIELFIKNPLENGLTRGEQMELARIALSALKNAPLALSDNHGRPRALVVPPAIEPDYKVIKSILPTANPDEYACCIAADMWNACRAAMLNGGKS
ncbi:hypothetical protein ABK79_07160 [Salmonella enterica subsp. enterica serovar Newport]|nr:hypothetical protein [Salmonella enterica subsp. enterica serovar Newport]ECT4433229.1 hypothetical protein [Salmonella enterica]ECN3870268.1 hypothetical protein [Salmonella enterica subsp. enterica serovar Newport]ECW9757977.1 hypothetical protein [Salmonella enterica subsp. enterica serovar Newport]EEJ7057863.1 hypothetical protein [Salmonella enterica]